MYSNIYDKPDEFHYENTPIQMYRKFHIAAQNIDCGYSLEPHR